MSYAYRVVVGGLHGVRFGGSFLGAWKSARFLRHRWKVAKSPGLVGAIAKFGLGCSGREGHLLVHCRLRMAVLIGGPWAASGTCRLYSSSRVQVNSASKLRFLPPPLVLDYVTQRVLL